MNISLIYDNSVTTQN